MSLEFDVLVIGGGIVGLTAALAMAQRGFTVAIIDAGTLKVDTSVSDSRVYAINKASQSLLEQLGAWSCMNLQRVSPYRQMYVWDAANGAHIDFDSRQIAAQNLGFIIEESVLKEALLQRVSTQANISLFPECPVDDLHSDEQGVRVFCEKRVWEGQLLMIADGAHSVARQKLKVELTSWPYQQQALVATVTVEKEHQKTAYQVFNPDGPLAFLPLADPHQCSIVWSTKLNHSQSLMNLDDDEFNESLTQAFAKKLGQVKVIGTRYQFPLHMRHVKQYTGNRWLLLGDAAHTIHPLAGLGLNVGLADVSSWIKCLDANKGALLSRKVLGAYQRERKHAVWQIIVLMELFKRLFSYSFAPISTLRGLGLDFCNESSLIKRFFIQYATG